MPLLKTDNLLSNRRFLSFLISQNFMGCGAFIQVVAIARLILDNTSSGLAAGFSIVSAPIAGIVFSLFAGSIGDKFKTRTLLVTFDIFRGLLVFLFIFCKSITAIFVLMLLVSTFDVLYNPSKNKMLTSVLDKEELIRGNALLYGTSGAVSLVMPILTGLIITTFGIKTALIAGSLSYFISAFFLSGVQALPPRQKIDTRHKQREIMKAFTYCFQTPPLKKAVLALAIFDFGTVCVNIAFYALAFDKLRVSSTFWGLILSIFYGMNVVAMVFLLQYRKKFLKEPILKALLLQIVVAFVWVYYSMTQNLHYLLIGIAAEGLCSALSTALLMTHILETSRKDNSARVMSIRDLCSNTAKIAGIGLTYLLLRNLEVNVVFITSAITVFVSILFQTAKWTGFQKARRHSSFIPVDYPK